MTALIYQTATELAQLIRDKQVSATDVLEAHLTHIEQHNPRLNAIVTLDAANARKRAAAADEALAAGEIWGPLHGVPVTFKDVFETAGVRTTSSFKPLTDHIPTQDATVVARLKSAGAIILGKTNMPMLALDIQCDSPIFGRTNNPWDLTRTPGGSTGGGAAAVVAGLSPLEIGSDLGGSVRIPAHFCGVYSLKPTDHLVSIAGHIPEPPGAPQGVRRMGMPGPVTRSVEDLELALTLIAGMDGRRWEAPPIPLSKVEPPDIQSVRIAWTDQFGDGRVSAETHQVLNQAVVDLAAAGCQIKTAAPENFNYDLAGETYGQIAGAEVGSGMAAIPRWLTRLQFSQISDPSTLKKGYLSGLRLKMSRYAQALTDRDQLISQLDQFLSQWDAWICPVTVGPAFEHTQMGQPIPMDGGQVPYFTANMSFTSIFNMTGNPVVVIPIGQSEAGLPIGIQIVGRWWQDMSLLAIAKTLDAVIGKFRRPPGFEA
jgi:amidase